MDVTTQFSRRPLPLAPSLAEISALESMPVQVRLDTSNTNLRFQFAKANPIRPEKSLIVLLNDWLVRLLILGD